MKKIMTSLIMLLSLSLFGQVAPDMPSQLGATKAKKMVEDTRTVSVGAFQVQVPRSWTQMNGQNLWRNSRGTSVNLISEAAPNYSMTAYADLSLKNMKKMIKSYQLLKKSNGKGQDVKYSYFKGKYNLKEVGGKGEIIIYTIFPDVGMDTQKYVITLGVLPANEARDLPVMRSIMASIKHNKNFKAKKKSPVKIINNKVSIVVPEGWVAQGAKNSYMDPKTRSSANVRIENAYGYSLDAYLNVSLKTLKKQIPSYKLIKRTKKVVNGKELGILFGSFNMYNNDLKLYSVVMDINGVKYVLSVGGLAKNFDAMNNTFNEIINSFKMIKK